MNQTGVIHQEPHEGLPLRSKALRAIALFILLICLMSIIWQVTRTLRPDSGATLSSYEGMTREEIQEELNRTVKDNMMSISVAPIAYIEPSGELTVNVINKEDNKFGQRFSVVQNDETAYQSGVIEPGKSINTCPSEGIEPGDAFIEIQATDLETGEAHGNPIRVQITVSRRS